MLGGNTNREDNFNRQSLTRGNTLFSIFVGCSIYAPLATDAGIYGNPDGSSAYYGCRKTMFEEYSPDVFACRTDLANATDPTARAMAGTNAVAIAAITPASIGAATPAQVTAATTGVAYAAQLSGYATTGQLITATNALYVAVTNWDTTQDAQYATTGTVAALTAWDTNALGAISNGTANAYARFSRSETNNWTPTLTMTAGQTYEVYLTHSTSNQVTTWPAGIKWQAGTTVGAITNTTGYMDTYGFVFRPGGATNGYYMQGAQ